MIKLLIIFFTLPLFAEEISCPKESLSIEYTSPITKNKKITCGYTKDGKLIKHGHEKEYKPDGSLVKSEYYVEGALSEPPSPTEKIVTTPKKQVELEVIETKGPSTPANPFGHLNFNDSED